MQAGGGLLHRRVPDRDIRSGKVEHRGGVREAEQVGLERLGAPIGDADRLEHPVSPGGGEVGHGQLGRAGVGESMAGRRTRRRIELDDGEDSGVPLGGAIGGLAHADHRSGVERPIIDQTVSVRSG